MDSHQTGRQSATSPQDIVGGFFLIVLAAIALYAVKDLPASGRVGFAAGTAPRIFAWGLGLLGLFLFAQGFFKEGPKLDKIPLRGPITILGSVLFFAVSIRYLGLFFTGIPMVVIASYAAGHVQWKPALVFAFAITSFCALLFPIGLNQPIPLWPTFL